MKKTLFGLRVPAVLTLLLALLGADAHAEVDLNLSYVSVDCYSCVFYPGSTISIGVTVENVGDEDSGEYDVTFYISDDSTITEDDYQLGSISGAASLGPGEDSSHSFEESRPDDFSSGEYYIGAIISGPTETNLSNNSDYYSDAVIIVPHFPNLVVLSVDYTWDPASDIVLPGGSIAVDIVVKNEGEGPTDGYAVDCYATSDTAEYFLGSADDVFLDVDQEHTFSISYEFPDDIPNDYYHIGVNITWENYPLESFSVWAGNPDLVWVGRPTDLAVQSVRATPAARRPDEDLVVHCLVENIGERDPESYTIDYYASTDTTIDEDDYHLGRVERGALPAGERDDVETTCRVPYSIPAGPYYIGLIASSQNEHNPANSSGRSATTVAVVHPAGYVCGHAEYQYSENPSRMYPVRCALVQIFEADNNDDPLDDRLLAQTHTDPNGNYGVVLTDAKNSTPEIYIKILTEGVAGAWPDTTSKIGVIKDEVFEETYSVVSEVYPHPGDDSVVINVRTPGNGEFIVFDSVVEGFIKAKAFFDVELDPATVFWPSEAGFSYYDPCDAGIYIEQFDARDRDVIMHEYGHVLAEVCGVAQGPVGEDARHYWNRDLRDYPVARTNQHAMNLAFREGWATLFSIATQYGNNDIGYPGAGDSNYDDGEGGATIKVDLDNVGEERYSPGQYFENMVAGALWDIFDDKNDEPDGKDTLSDPSLTMTWTISQDYKPRDIQDFWNNWFQKYEYEQEMKYIFEVHNLRFAKPK